MQNLLTNILSKKAVFWDFDGCLCDSERIHFLAYAKAFQKVGHVVNEEEYYETFTHTGAGVPKEIENYKLQCDPDLIRKDKINYYWELISQGKAKVYPEIPKIVSLLNKKGILNVIASNSPAEEINLILSQQLEKFKIEGVFGFESGMRKKPFPDLYLKALKELKLKPTEAIVIEDSERGILAAQKADIQAIWIQTPTNTRFESSAPYVARLTHAELLNLLENKAAS